jgi:ubiquinone biosynthesis protein UbiJ
MRSFEEVRDLLADKFRTEKQRLKTFGTKANSFDLANVIARHVLGLMAESRCRELRKLDKKLDTFSNDDQEKVSKYITERIKATSAMAKIITKYADEAEKNRPWLSKAEQKAKQEDDRRLEKRIKKQKEKEKHKHRSHK